MIRTVLFDLDGTIVNSNELILQSFLNVLKDIAPDVTREFMIPHMGKTLDDQLRIFSGREHIDDLVPLYRKYNLENHDRLIEEFPHVREVISRLHSEGIRMGIVTTKIRQTTLMGLKLCGLEPYMETIVTLEDVDHPKPHPEPVRKAVEALGANPEETLMVGDSPYDILSANSAGVISVGVGWSLKGEETLSQYHPQHIIHDMRDLYSIVGMAGA